MPKLSQRPARDGRAGVANSNPHFGVASSPHQANRATPGSDIRAARNFVVEQTTANQLDAPIQQINRLNSLHYVVAVEQQPARIRNPGATKANARVLRGPS